jgi:hypothetical protein
MGLKKLFVITVLAGAMSVLGCGDDGGGNGNGGSGAVGNGGTGGGGTGGGGAESCTGDFCDLPEPKAACEFAINFCNTDPEVDLTTEQCDAAGNKFCQIDFGAGGAGGTGGTGGTSGGNCDYGDCMDPGTQRDICESAVRICENTPFLPPAVEAACIEGANVDACGPR